MTTLARPVQDAPAVTGVGFTHALRAEWIKLWSVRSTWWTVLATIALGGLMTILVVAVNADWLASDEAGKPPEAFLTWGLMLAQICAVVLGALVVTGEYSTAMIRTTFSAVPSRGRVMAAKAVVLSSVLLVLGSATALLGYLGGNQFLKRQGIGVPLEGDMLRAIYGSGLFLAGAGLFSLALGFALRHTAGTIALAFMLLVIVGNLIPMPPGAFGEWVTKLMPGSTGATVAQAVPSNPALLDPWTGYGVFLLETTVLLTLAWALVRRRDA